MPEVGEFFLRPLNRAIVLCALAHVVLDLSCTRSCGCEIVVREEDLRRFRILLQLRFYLSPNRCLHVVPMVCRWIPGGAPRPPPWCPDGVAMMAPMVSDPILPYPFLSYPFLPAPRISLPILSAPSLSPSVLHSLANPILPSPVLSSPVLPIPSDLFLS